MAEGDITRGCNPPLNDRYCPHTAIPRDQMAAFLARTLDLPPSESDHFIDDDDNVFEDAINRIAQAGITKGCNPPSNDRYCPDLLIPRKQMAAFLDRAFGAFGGAEDFFVDDDGSLFERHINNIAAAGITEGCNPPDNDRYCPEGHVPRDQMASFLSRATGIQHADPTPSDHDVVVSYSWGPEGNPEQSSLAVFGTRIHQALHPEVAFGRPGWSIAGRIFFLPVPSGGDLQLWLTDDDNVGERSPVCSDRWSCTVGNDLYINDDNFATATETWGDRHLADYQRYVVNHEVGHFLGFEARSHYNDAAYCGFDGAAPVMMQQSIDLDGCDTNVWPLGWERDCIEERWLRDIVDQGGVLNGQCPQ